MTLRHPIYNKADKYRKLARHCMSTKCFSRVRFYFTFVTMYKDTWLFEIPPEQFWHIFLYLRNLFNDVNNTITVVALVYCNFFILVALYSKKQQSYISICILIKICLGQKVIRWLVDRNISYRFFTKIN